MQDKNGRILSKQMVGQKIQARICAISEEFLLFFLNLIGCIPSHMIRKFFYYLSGINLGAGSTIHSKATFYTLGKLTIGQDTIIGEKATLDTRGEIVIGNHVDIASEVMLYSSQHDINAPDFRAVYGKIEIEDYIFIGPRAIILPGVKLGKGAVIGAGAVVTKSVAPFSVVAGVPAKEIAKRQLTNPQYRLGRAALFR